MESTFNFLKMSINGFSWYEHIADQEDQTTADKKRKQQQKLPSTLNKRTYY